MLNFWNHEKCSTLKPRILEIMNYFEILSGSQELKISRLNSFQKLKILSIPESESEIRSLQDFKNIRFQGSIQAFSRFEEFRARIKWRSAPPGSLYFHTNASFTYPSWPTFPPSGPLTAHSHHYVAWYTRLTVTQITKRVGGTHEA